MNKNEKFIEQKNIKEVYNFWKKVIPEIKKQSFSRDQIMNIKLNFIDQLSSKRIIDQVFFNDYRLWLLETELDLALEISYSNYRKESKSLWLRIFDSFVKRLPEVVNLLKK
ncbi:MAG: hypothetical protein J7L45_01640 [Candidatus Aenigmarchaeota archaeon]|nr:hypothetical protein [Candidatus Aenigmarchaeota archaeon]